MHYAIHIYVLHKLSMLVEMSVTCKYKFNGAVRVYFKPKKVFLIYNRTVKYFNRAVKTMLQITTLQSKLSTSKLQVIK